MLQMMRLTVSMTEIQRARGDGVPQPSTMRIVFLPLLVAVGAVVPGPARQVAYRPSKTEDLSMSPIVDATPSTYPAGHVGAISRAVRLARSPPTLISLTSSMI
jgi:hypothetical protein